METSTVLKIDKICQDVLNLTEEDFDAELVAEALETLRNVILNGGDI